MLSMMLMVLVMMAFETSTVLGMLRLMGLKVVLLLLLMSMPTAGIHVAVRVSSELLNSAVSMPVQIMMVIIRVHRVIPRQTTALASIIWSKAVASVVVHRSITIMRSIVLQLWRMRHGIAFLIGRYVSLMTAPIIKTYILGKSISNIFILLISSGVSSKSTLCWVMKLCAVVTLDSALR